MNGIALQLDLRTHMRHFQFLEDIHLTQATAAKEKICILGHSTQARRDAIRMNFKHLQVFADRVSIGCLGACDCRHCFEDVAYVVEHVLVYGF